MNKKEKFTPQACKGCIGKCPEVCENCIYIECRKQVDEKLVFYKWNHTSWTKNFDNHYEEFIAWYKKYFMLEE